MLFEIIKSDLGPPGVLNISTIGKFIAIVKFIPVLAYSQTIKINPGAFWSVLE